MTVPANPLPGLPLGPPVEVGADTTAWERVRSDLGDFGTALLYAHRGALRPPSAAGERLSRVLGCDWMRYLDLVDAEAGDRYAASRTLVRSAAEALHGDGDALQLGYGPTGRPYLRGRGHIDMSISHVGELVVAGLTTQGLIGVDAERADRELYGSDFGRQLCTPYETITLAALPEEDRNPHLVRLLTLKEAYGKAIGRGTRLRFSDFGFGPDGRPVRAQLPDGGPGTGDEWTFRTFVLTGGYCVSVAVYDAGPAPRGGGEGPCADP